MPEATNGNGAPRDRSAGAARKRLPPWLRVAFRQGGARKQVRGLLRDLRLHTVCESATCPNLCECWGRRTATFMLMGSVCTRNCRFCDVRHGEPLPPDPEEPENVATAAEKLGLRYVVLTCVTRDDLADGGAAHFAATVRAVRQRLPDAGVEVLTSDFQGRRESLVSVLASAPDVFNHNVETCARLTPEIRSGADYDRSLQILSTSASLAEPGKTEIKSGFMLGLGETDDEVHELLRDLRRHRVTILTIGQYLAPSAAHWPVSRYVHPTEFEQWRDRALQDYGFRHVASGPLVRSSYMAEQTAMDVKGEA